MGYGRHDAGAVPGILFEPATAAVVHSGIDMVGISQDFVTGHALYVSNKANTTGILFKGRVVQALFPRKSDFAVNSSIVHAFNSFSGALTNLRVTWPDKNCAYDMAQPAEFGPRSAAGSGHFLHRKSGPETISPGDPKSRANACAALLYIF